MEIPFDGGKILEEILIISEVLMMWEIIRRDDWCLIRPLVDSPGSQYDECLRVSRDHNRESLRVVFV